LAVLLNSKTCESEFEGSARTVLLANVTMNGLATSWLTALHTGMMQQAQTVIELEVLGRG
jgi:hypothetical protein